jgi:hypothetical protein
MFLSKDKNKTDKERIDLLQQAIDLSQRRAEKDEEFAKRQYDIDVAQIAIKTKITGITEDEIKSFIALDEKQQLAALEKSEKLKEFYNIVTKDGIIALEESQSAITKANTTFFQENKRNLSLMTGLINEIEDEKDNQEEKRKEKNDKLNDAVNKSNEDFINTEIENQEKLAQIERENLALSMENSTAEADHAINEAARKRKKTEEEEAEAAQKKAEIEAAAFEAASIVENAIFDNRRQKIDDEIGAIEAQRQRDLENKNLTEAQKKAINDKADKEVAEKKRRMAKLDKAQAAFNIGIEIAKALASGNYLQAIIGGVQLAVVLAKKIPEYFNGTNYHKGGLAMVGDDGRGKAGGIELIKEPSKPAYLAGFGVRNLERGTKVIPNHSIEKWARNKQMKAELDDSRIVSELTKLNNKKSATTSITRDGIVSMVKHGNTTIKRVERWRS